ncbi:hypothetical protein [Sphingomonas sp.]|uniref:hypothetical protein n=1 Tax=Sphingomonas sp. TaxID=28214 RepID=UPI0035C83E53
MIPFSQDNLLVLVALGLVALLALLTILGMIKGQRLKGARRAAEKEEQARIDALREDGVEQRDVDDAGEVFDDAPQPSRASTLAPEGQRAGDGDHRPAAATPVAQPATDEQPSEPLTADEPIAAAAPLDASPASAAADTPGSPEPAPAHATSGGSITQLKGLGPKIAARLGELGITQVDQLAWLDDQEAADLDAQLGAFQGRMERDRWREQARFLAQGDRAGYEAQFGKLG